MEQKTEKKLEDKLFLNLGELLAMEEIYVRERRKKKSPKNTTIKFKEDSLGIALSGGGIRSATLCLGLMEEFNKIGLIEKADYLSSVSGGGYLASYIHSSLNKPESTSYEQLFTKDNAIQHLRDHRKHLYLWPNYKSLSQFVLLLVAIAAVVSNWLWVILPAIFYCTIVPFGWCWYVILILLMVLPGLLISPNVSSLHRYYKQRLKKAYLWPQQDIRLKDLQNPQAPYPLINATVHLDEDDYDKAQSISYRGTINTNYFLFSPLYCGSQVTHYAKTSKSLYAKVSLATAMATSAAAVNTFMGNMNVPIPIRWGMILANLRTGYLAPSPFLKNWFPVFWPWYTYLEMRGKAKTTSYKIQVSDGGHIENLAVFELLRRQVKTIIVVDGGQDNDFGFFDLRNLIIRARNELGIVIKFDKDNGPSERIKPDLITGTSQSHFAVAKISGLKGSYTPNYEGVLVYIKSSVLTTKVYKLRQLKKDVEALKGRIEVLQKEIKSSKNGGKGKEVQEECLKELEEKCNQLEEKRRELDHTMYRTYTPKFPHEPTANQFFSKEQWDAYYHLGKNIGKDILESLALKKEDSQLDIHRKCSNY
ncbi:MAG: hypothetical protein AB8E82_09100 [Aureispira sp.]